MATLRRSIATWFPRKTESVGAIDELISQYSMGLYVLYFGTNRKYSEVEHHTIVFGEQYKELLQRIFSGEPAGDDLSLYAMSFLLRIQT